MKKALNYSEVWFLLSFFFFSFKNLHISLKSAIMGNKVDKMMDYLYSVFKL